MTLRSIATIAALLVSAFAGTHAQRLGESEIADIQALVPSCNSNVCFVFEGTNFLNAEEFQSQIDFIIDVTTVIGDVAGQLQGAQFALSPRIVGPQGNATEFISDLQDVVQVTGSRSFPRAGLGFCAQELRRLARDSDEELESTLVFLGTGISNFGGNPVTIADSVRQMGGQILGVAVGDAADFAAVSDIAGGAGNVFDIDATDARAEIEAIVLDICA